MGYIIHAILPENLTEGFAPKNTYSSSVCGRCHVATGRLWICVCVFVYALRAA